MLAFSPDPGAVRIGYGESAPYCYTGPNGKAAGFLVDVFEEAARREGVVLAWTHTGPEQTNTKAVTDGRFDLLPLAVATPERRELLFVTEPWWWEPTILLVRADRSQVYPARLRRVALPGALLPGAAEHYPGAQRIAAGSAPQALEQVCRDNADAALLGAAYIRDLVNARPAVCESVPLRILDSPVTADFSIIANRSFQSTAERLRRRITQMTADGTLPRIAGLHPPISTPHAARLTENLRTRFERQRLRTWLIFLSVFLAMGVLALAWLIVSKRRLGRLLDVKSRTEQRLREREAELRQRTSDLVRSNEDLQTFVYSVSHDLQEPIRNQALYSELLERRYRQALPPGANEVLQTIRSSAVRAQEMMASLLKYSRAGQGDMERGPVDCAVLVERVVEELREPLSEAGAEVKAGPLPIVWGWEDRLRQVFQNLIENAIKYRRREGGQTAVMIEAAQRGDEWHFSVSDNGIGFKQEYAERIFGLFKRLHGQEQYGGSGIGLALCRRIVERHGGRIWAEGREGEGSTFYFALPVYEEGSDRLSAA
jgi:signal transduction histidine kinase